MLNSTAEAAFSALTSMEPVEAEGMKDRVFRRSNFGGSEDKVCEIKPDFGNGQVPVYIAADNKSYATAKAVGAKTDRLIRMVIKAGQDDIALNTSWDSQTNGWIMKWKATTVSKEIDNSVAEARILDVLKEAGVNCR